MLRFALLLSTAALAGAEVHTLALKQVVELAARQSPDVVLARLDEQRAEHAVRVARDPFFPKVNVGSGLAYSNGFPMAIAGQAPSVLHAQAVQVLFDRELSYRAAQAKEDARGAAMDTAAKRDEVVLRAALLFLDAEHSARAARTARKQVEHLERVAESVRLRVGEGRELEIENKRAALNLAKARQRAQSLEVENEFAERSLAMVLGMAPGDRMRADEEDRRAPDVPGSEDASVEAAMHDNREIRRMESAVLAKSYEIRANRASRWPHMDLVADYGMFSRFNNYDDFYRKFERHNGQLGVSFRLPLYHGPAASAQAAQAETDAARLRTEINTARARIVLDARKSYQDVKKAETAREVALLDLEVAREQLSILLAQMEEGRVTLRQVEQARYEENEKWLALFDAEYALEKMRLTLLKQTGSLMAALR